MSKSVQVLGNIYGPFSIQQLIQYSYCKKTKHSGVYVWGVKSGNNYFAIYVGKSSNICERVFQHIIRFFGGEYPIPDWKTIVNPLRNVKNLKKYAENNAQLPNGLLYYPTGHFSFFTPSYYSNQNPVLINSTLQKIENNFFVAWVDIANYSQNSAQLEGNLAHHIGLHKLIGKKYSQPNCNNTLIQPLINLNIL